MSEFWGGMNRISVKRAVGGAILLLVATQGFTDEAKPLSPDTQPAFEISSGNVSEADWMRFEQKLDAWNFAAESKRNNKPYVMQDLCDEEQAYIMQMVEDIGRGKTLNNMQKSYITSPPRAMAFYAALHENIQQKVKSGKLRWQTNPSSFGIKAGIPMSDAKEFLPAMVLTPFELAYWQITQDKIGATAHG